MEKTTKKSRAHIQYKLADGTKVPGVTTILNILAKPALVPWANRLGLQGIDVGKYVDEKADIGTCAHYLIHCDLTGETPDLSEYSPSTVDAAENGFLKWLDWKKGKKIEAVESELPLVSEFRKYGGTIDIYCLLDGVPTLIDIKTSGSGIYPEMRYQVAAYRVLLIDSGRHGHQALIIRVGRDDTEGFQVERVGDLDKLYLVFSHCLDIYRLQKELKV